MFAVIINVINIDVNVCKHVVRLDKNLLKYFLLSLSNFLSDVLPKYSLSGVGVCSVDHHVIIGQMTVATVHHVAAISGDRTADVNGEVCFKNGVKQNLI